MHRTYGPRLALLAIAAGLAACAGTPDEAAPPAAAATLLPLRADAAQIIVPGEECVYGIAWGGILPVGRIVYRTRAVSSPDGPLLVYDGTTEPAAYVAAFLEAGGTTEVHVDPATFLPLTSFWVNADPHDPVSRTAWFDRGNDRAWTAKWTATALVTRDVRGPSLADPMSAIYLARILALPPAGEDLRLLIVEGEDLYVMSLGAEGRETLVHDGAPVLCDRLAVRTWRLGDDGRPAETEASNSLFVWLSTEPGRPILRMSGRTLFGIVALKLARRTLGGNHGP